MQLASSDAAPHAVLMMAARQQPADVVSFLHIKNRPTVWGDFLMQLGLAGAAEDVAQLVADELLDVGTGGLQVLARVELVGMLVEELADGAGHGKTQVGVDVDLADGQLGCMTELLFGNTNSVGHLAAVFVDHLHILLGHRGGTVKNNGEAGQALDYLVQDIEA